MSKKDFELIANIFASNKRSPKGLSEGEYRAACDEREWLVYVFAARLSATNPRFDRARFLRACGVES